MFSQLVLFQKYFPLTKSRCRESYIARIFQLLPYLGTFSETSTAADQAVAAVNFGEQGPSSVSQSLSYPDETTIQHNVGDTGSSGRKNEKNSREPIISETIKLNDDLCASITLLFSIPCIELRLSQLLVTTPLRNAVNIPAFLHFKVRPGELFSIPQKLN